MDKQANQGIGYKRTYNQMMQNQAGNDRLTNTTLPPQGNNDTSHQMNQPRMKIQWNEESMRILEKFRKDKNDNQFRPVGDVSKKLKVDEIGKSSTVNSLNNKVEEAKIPTTSLGNPFSSGNIKKEQSIASHNPFSREGLRKEDVQGLKSSINEMKNVRTGEFNAKTYSNNPFLNIKSEIRSEPQQSFTNPFLKQNQKEEAPEQRSPNVALNATNKIDPKTLLQQPYQENPFLRPTNENTRSNETERHTIQDNKQKQAIVNPFLSRNNIQQDKTSEQSHPWPSPATATQTNLPKQTINPFSTLATMENPFLKSKPSEFTEKINQNIMINPFAKSGEQPKIQQTNPESCPPKEGQSLFNKDFFNLNNSSNTATNIFLEEDNENDENALKELQEEIPIESSGEATIKGEVIKSVTKKYKTIHIEDFALYDPGVKKYIKKGNGNLSYEYYLHEGSYVGMLLFRNNCGINILFKGNVVPTASSIDKSPKENVNIAYLSKIITWGTNSNIICNSLRIRFQRKAQLDDFIRVFNDFISFWQRKPEDKAHEHSESKAANEAKDDKNNVEIKENAMDNWSKPNTMNKESSCEVKDDVISNEVVTNEDKDKDNSEGTKTLWQEEPRVMSIKLGKKMKFQ